MSRRDDFRDDGRTVADMSGVERPGLLFPRRRSAGGAGPRAAGTGGNSLPWSALTRSERRAAILAVFSAALAVGFVYIIGIGAVTLLLLWLWA